MTSAAEAQVLNEICLLRINHGAELTEVPRWLKNIRRMPEVYEYWQPEPLQHQLDSDDPVTEIYDAEMAQRFHLRSLLAECPTEWAEVSEDLFYLGD